MTHIPEGLEKLSEKEARQNSLAAALVILAEHGIPPDVQELLVYGGNGVKPGGLSAIIEAARLKAEAERDDAVAALAIANTGGLKLLYAIREALGWSDKHGLSLLPDGVWDVARRESECQTILARIRKVRDGYADQAKFADVEQASYFREFIRRLDQAVEGK